MSKAYMIGMAAWVTAIMIDLILTNISLDVQKKRMDILEEQYDVLTECLKESKENDAKLIDVQIKHIEALESIINDIMFLKGEEA